MASPAQSSPSAPSLGTALIPLPNESLPAFIQRGANLSSIQSYVSSQSSGFNIDSTDSQGDTGVLVAARLGNLDMLEYLASKGANLHHTNHKGSSALIAAAMKGFPRIVKYLIQTGANVDHATDSNDTALSLAIWQNHTECCIDLIEAGADINHVDKFGDIMLMDAARHGALEVMKKLLVKMTLSVDHQNKKGDSALHRAASQGDVEPLKLLLEHKANPCALNKGNFSPLATALVNGKFQCASVLIPVSKDVLECEDESGCTPLIYLVGATAKNLGWEQINLIIENGAKLDGIEALSSSQLGKRVVMGGVLLHAAAANSQLQTLKLLLSTGNVDVNYKNVATKRNALQSHLAKDCDLEVVQTLIDAGIEVDYQDKDGSSALMLAVKANSVAVVSALLTVGADIALADEAGETAMDLCNKKVDKTILNVIHTHIERELGYGKLLLQAAQSGDLIKIKELIEGRTQTHETKDQNKPIPTVDVNVVDSNGRTALMAAANFNQVAAIKMLLNHGADVEIEDRDGNSALSMAVKGEHKDAIVVLSHALSARVNERSSNKGEKDEVMATSRFLLRTAFNIQSAIDVAKENQQLKRRVAELQQNVH